MSTILRPCLTFIALAALGAAVLGLSRPGALTELGLDSCDLPEINRVLEENRQLTGVLERRNEVVVRRMHAKREVAWDLIDGRLTLIEAAARFRLLNDSPSEFPNRHLGLIEGRNDAERLCRQVIAWAHNELIVREPRRAGEFAAALTAQLDALLAAEGELRLPEAPAAR